MSLINTHPDLLFFLVEAGPSPRSEAGARTPPRSHGRAIRTGNNLSTKQSGLLNRSIDSPTLVGSVCSKFSSLRKRNDLLTNWPKVCLRGSPLKLLHRWFTANAPQQRLYLRRTRTHHDNLTYSQYRRHSQSPWDLDLSRRRRHLRETEHQQRLHEQQHM